MRTRMPAVCPLLVAALAAAGWPEQVLAQTNPLASYSLLKADVTLNEPVFLKYVIENGPDVLAMARSSYGDRGTMRAKLLRPDGRQEQGPRPRIDEASAITSIGPFTTVTAQLLLNEWFDFDIPGRYFLDVTITFGANWPIPADGHLVIDVGPRDPVRLREIFADLAVKALGPANTSQEFEAVGILANMVDPEAVPYLARVLDKRKRTHGPMLLAALGRIADGPAVDVLISQVNSDDEDVRSSARGELTRIEEKTNDSLIKLKIRASRQ